MVVFRKPVVGNGVSRRGNAAAPSVSAARLLWRPFADLVGEPDGAGAGEHAH